ncbi:hypothetical protein [Chromobacterium haemolyticum]|uniref:hypothetical protein n=1 Tax=Chromobacterium haemolyticum TaxID=394935 RepID=UPI00307F07D4
MRKSMAAKTRHRNPNGMLRQRLALKFYRQSRSRRPMMKSVDVKHASIESYWCKMN